MALLVLPLTLLVLWTTSFAWLTNARRLRRLFTAELALCGAGALVAIVLITTTPPDDLGAGAADFTPVWGWVLLFSSVLSCMMVAVLWALTALLALRHQRPRDNTSGESHIVRSTVGRHPVLSAVAGTVALFLLVIAPTSHIFHTNRDDLVPPDSVSAEVDAFRATLKNTPEIISSDVVAKRGGYGGDGSPNNPSIWLITAAVTAAPGTTAAHNAADILRQGLATAGSVVRSFGVLTVTGDGYSDTTVEFDDQQDSRTVGKLVDTGLLLRTVPGVQAVAVSDSALPSITIASPSRWSDTVRDLRAQPGFGSDALPSVTVITPGRAGSDALIGSVVVDRTVPDQVTLTGLATIANQTGVTSLVYDSARPRGSQAGWRPTLTITTTTTATRGDVAQQLTAFDTQPALAVGTPRAIYTVNAETDEIGSGITGYLGLPEGTPEPDDLAPLPEPPPDPEMLAATCAENEKLVRTLLDNGGDLAGIHGTPSIDTTNCATGTGTTVVGRVTIPIFDIADTADPAYNTIVASWNSQGYTSKDRAGPLELRTGGPLKLLAISGGPAGITITATSY
ncbi:hypothetical protein [Subtercola boreus]|uniref:hypothetical protein n=1 Tax=Subtercola boreus TaxID=120213 RepID=UPI0011C07A26|nr:hypothetical protein [Subtercola boreus]